MPERGGCTDSIRAQIFPPSSSPWGVDQLHRVDEREEDGERLRSRSPNQQPQHLRESCLLASVPGQPWSSGEELASVAVTQGEKARKHLSKGLLVTLELCWEWQAWSPPHGVAGPQDGCSPSHPIRAGSFGESRHRQGT
ncbi:hypothetical protein AV530_019340 [Patagioenas fasciata monilis]|uniref:Uncharacterized protein n=1 Tax=Patagioenas fasciata monilis TaxID=372326 RepID=A0A1V4JD66_PATFA|nr:hypothetical protein AV530_019340 [Patagioenas fasciata monilis]